MQEKLAYNRRTWRMVLYCWLAYATVYIGKKTLSVNLSDMIAEGVCDNMTGGTIGTAYLACYAIGQFINGWVGEKVHPPYMICGGLMLAGFANILMCFGDNPVYFAVVWGFCGLVCSMLWSPIIRAIAAWSSDEIGQAAAASMSVTIPVGTVFCYGICALTLKFGGWRTSFVTCGSILCVAAILLYIAFHTLRDHMRTPDSTSAKLEENPSTVSNNSHPHIKLFCAGLVFAAACILFNGMIKDGLDLWIPTVLTDRFVGDSSTVSVICTILPIANIGGVYMAKFVYSRFRLTELATCAILFCISAFALTCALLMIHFVTTGGVLSAIAMTLLLALSSSAMLGANNMLLSFIPLHFGKIGRAAAVTGMLNCFSYAAASVSGVAVGIVSEHSTWEVVFLVFVAAAVFGFIFSALGVKPMKKKFEELRNL